MMRFGQRMFRQALCQSSFLVESLVRNPNLGQEVGWLTIYRILVNNFLKVEIISDTSVYQNKIEILPKRNRQLSHVLFHLFVVY